MGIWPQLVSGSSVKRTALTRKSLTIWSTGNGEKRNYCKFMTRGTLRVVVNGRVLEPNSKLWRDAAEPEPSWFFFLFSPPGHCWSWPDVSFWCWLDTRGASFSLSHTFGWEMCAGNVTGVSERNPIHCGGGGNTPWYFARKGHQPELYTQSNR